MTTELEKLRNDIADQKFLLYAADRLRDYPAAAKVHGQLARLYQMLADFEKGKK